ncbi:hypothetical protein Tco_0491771 [Tanacetum coccineum]
MEAAVDQCSVHKKLIEIEKKELKLENERLLEHIICQDVVNIVMHADVKSDNVLPVQNTFLDDNIALDVLKMENDHLMELLVSQDLVILLEAHVDYIKITKANADTLRDTVEQARTSNPLDNVLAYVCMYTKQIQDLLVYVSDTCPSSPLKSKKLVAVTPMNKARKVTCAKISDSSENNTQTQVDLHKTQTTNKPLVPSTNVKCSTNASRSKPQSEIKNTRIPQTSSSNHQRVETHTRPRSSTTNASADNSLGPTPHRKEKCMLQCAKTQASTIDSWIHQFRTRAKLNSPTPYAPPSKKDYEILFQPLFDEYFNPPPCNVSLYSVVVDAPRAVDRACSLSSTTIDQDVPSASTDIRKRTKIKTKLDKTGHENERAREDESNAQQCNSKENVLLEMDDDIIITCYEIKLKEVIFDQFQPSQFPVNHQPPCEINPKELVEKYIAMLKTVLKHKVQTYVGKSLEILLAEGRLYKLIDTLQRKQCFPDDMLDLLPQIEEDIKTLNDDLEHKEQAAKISILRKFPVYDDDDDEYSIQTQEYLKKFSSTITPVLSTEEPDNSLSMGDEHLSTIPVTESDEVIKSSVENLVLILRELEGIPDKLCDIPTCDNDRINVESELVESLINRDTSIVYSSKIDPLLEEFAGELARIAPIPQRIVEADFDPNDDTLSDDDSFEDIEYVDASPPDSEIVSLEEVNDDQEEKEFDLEDIFQIQDVILREKLLNINRLISNIESLKDNTTPDCVLNYPSSFPIPIVDSDSFFEESDTSLSHLDNSLPEFETSSDHTEETRSGSTITHANYSLPGYDSFLF